MEMTRHGNESILRCIITMELELEIVGQTLNWDRCRVIENYLGLVGNRYHNRWWWWDSTRNETRTMELVAEVDARVRVPFGSHGAWLGVMGMAKVC